MLDQETQVPVCYLHVGTARTGTTAIQRYLSAHRAKLLESGLLVPSATIGSGNHVPIVWDVCGRPGAPCQGAATSLREEMRANCKADVVLSAEAMEMQFSTKGISPIVSLFAEAGYSIKIIVYVRDQVERLNSHYSYLVQTLRLRGELSDFSAYLMLQGVLHYDRWLPIARKSRSELIARAYNLEIRRRGVVRDFLSLLGRSDIADTIDESVNASVGPVPLAVARELKGRLCAAGLRPNEEQYARCHDMMRDLILEGGRESDAFWGFTPAQAQHVRSHFRSSNNAFARAVWQRSWRKVYGEGRDRSRNEFLPGTGDEREPAFHELLDVAWERLQALGPFPRAGRAPELGDIIEGVGKTLYLPAPY